MRFRCSGAIGDRRQRPRQSADWRYGEGVFRFFEHPVHFVREQAHEGKYVIQSEEPRLSPSGGGPLRRSVRSGTGLRCDRFAAGLSPQARACAGPHLRRCARLPAPPRDRGEAQGRPVAPGRGGLPNQPEFPVDDGTQVTRLPIEPGGAFGAVPIGSRVLVRADL